MPSPNREEILKWDITYLSQTSFVARKMATLIPQLSSSLAYHISAMDWSDGAKNAANDRIHLEQRQMDWLAAAYDELEDACDAAYTAMSYNYNFLHTVSVDWRNNKTPFVQMYDIGLDWTVIRKGTGSVGPDGYYTSFEQDDNAINETIRLQAMAKQLGIDDEDHAPKITAAIQKVESRTHVTPQ
ncbi:MAG: hypothetical protein HOQ24_18980 [Mycobacteriaceae bacterium]|nr:hypothetical protein [Mycobacteriaceae bacterium]